MALTIRAICRNSSYLQFTKPVTGCVVKNYSRVLSSGLSNRFTVFEPLSPNYAHVRPLSVPFRHCTSQPDPTKPPPEPEKKLGLYQRFKAMYRDYWYVLVPVHLATSAVWLGTFYYVVKSGVDIIGLMESLGISETLLKPLKESKAGYVALTFALYKLAAPLRYAVTLGGTTYAIRKLTAIGWIRPVPSSQRIKEMIQEKKGDLQDRFNESKQHYQTQMSHKKTQVMEEMKRYKMEMRNMKNKVKKM